MLDRCYRPKMQNYRLYGAKGITVCERWRTSFVSFLADMGPRPSSQHSIERNDSNGNYEPSNCRWATAIEQSSNTSRNVYVDICGERLTVTEAARRHGVKRWTLRRHTAAGLTPEQVVAGDKPKTQRARLYDINGVKKTRMEWAAIYGIHPHTVQTRLLRGWSLVQALTNSKYDSPKRCQCEPNKRCSTE
jgi:hypothetical protein